jgi:hypothetical protein
MVYAILLIDPSYKYILDEGIGHCKNMLYLYFEHTIMLYNASFPWFCRNLIIQSGAMNHDSMHFCQLSYAYYRKMSISITVYIVRNSVRKYSLRLNWNCLLPTTISEWNFYAHIQFFYHKYFSFHLSLFLVLESLPLVFVLFPLTFN